MTAMAGNTAYPFEVSVTDIMKFFVDIPGHHHHFTGQPLLQFIIRSKIMGRISFGRLFARDLHMTVAACYAQCRIDLAHDRQ